MDNCPHCGGILTDPDAKPHVDGNILHVDGRQIRVEPKQAEVVSLLIKRLGKLVTDEAIIDWMYALEDPDKDPMSRSTLQVHICRLRRTLKGTSYAIMTQRSLGYTLDRIDRFNNGERVLHTANVRNHLPGLTAGPRS